MVLFFHMDTNARHRELKMPSQQTPNTTILSLLSLTKKIHAKSSPHVHFFFYKGNP